MLSWVVKVVPQPPEPTPKRAEDQKEEKAAAPAAPPAPQEKKVTFQDEHKAEAQKADRAKQEAQVAEGNSTASGCQPGVLTWISGALPLPAVSPKVSRANSTAPEENTASSKPEDEKGVMAWIAHGLEKVVPHPDLKSKECAAVEPPAEVCPAAAAPAEPQVLVVEVESDREDADNQRLPPRMIDWIKQGIEKVVPQPEIHVRAKADSNEKNEASAAAKAPPPQPPAAPKPAADTERSPKEAEQQPNMMGWIVSGIGRMLPQPVQKQDTGSDEVQTISIVQNKSDLVLEDVEMEDGKQKVKETKEEPRTKENVERLKKETEDAETQMDQLTPLMDTIKKEAGEAVLAQMEERLQRDRLEAARVAEDMARKAAEEAVRQLEVEHSAKIVIETLPESTEQLPNILEEENEDDPEDPVDSCQAEDHAEGKSLDVQVEPVPETVKPPSPPQEDTDSSTDVEPASETGQLDSQASQPITKQPQAPVTSTVTTDEAGAEAAKQDEGGCEAPDLCSPIKSLMLRFPRAAECLKSCRKLMHDHYLTPPKLSMPIPPPELAQLAQELLQLPKQARQCCMSIVRRLNCLYSKSQPAQQP